MFPRYWSNVGELEGQEVFKSGIWESREPFLKLFVREEALNVVDSGSSLYWPLGVAKQAWRPVTGSEAEVAASNSSIVMLALHIVSIQYIFLKMNSLELRGCSYTVGI